MYINTNTNTILDLIKEENNRYYFIDIYTGNEVDYSESTYKRYIKQIGTTLVEDSKHFTKTEIYKEVAYHGMGLYSWMKSKIGNLEFKDEEKYADDIKVFEKILYVSDIESEDEVYVLLRQGNYLPQWMLENYTNLEELAEPNGLGYIRGTYKVFDNEKSKATNIDKFNKLKEIFPEILDATSSKPIRPTKIGRDLTKEFVLTGIVTLGPNGLYIKKKDREVIK